MTEIKAIVQADSRELVEVFLSRGGVALGQEVLPMLREGTKAAGTLSVRPSVYSAAASPATFEFIITCQPALLQELGGEDAIRTRFINQLLTHAKGFLKPRAASKEIR